MNAEEKSGKVMALYDRMKVIEKEHEELQKEWEWLNKELLSILGEMLNKNFSEKR